jgi:hypothetical protein
MPVRAPPDRTRHYPRARIRTDARLDAASRQTVDDLARHFHRPRAAVLRQIMHWGMCRRPIEKVEQSEGEGPVRHLYFYVESELHGRVQQAAIAAGVKMAPWLRHMVRRVTLADFPASWQAARFDERSHDSRRYATRFMLRLDASPRQKLQEFVEYFGVSKAAVMRQLIRQATPDDFPPSWQKQAAERHAAETRSARCR